MDFFRSQDIARRNTVRLVALFALALLSLIAITNLLVMTFLGWFAGAVNVPFFQQVDWRLFAWITLAILAVVAFGSLYKIVSLAGGGARVAEMLQGRLLLPGSSQLAEQKILNVVEEMAIASGTPVPPVYVLEEDAINAFAAGYTPGDAVIGITRGAMETLSRDELQGVIAHEFSHILHGDMRLNIRLIGILHGIMVLGVMGYYLVRTTSHSRRSRNGGNIAVVGIGLMVIGYAGTLFGNLIKSAVSRQREFLADASAVQYTRNPDGIANALIRIGASASGSVMENPGTAEISHALFSNGMKRSLSSLFATHPPLEKRIRRLQPLWDGSFSVVSKSSLKNQQSNDKYALKYRQGVSVEGQGSAPDGGIITGAGGLAVLALTDALLAQAGNPREADLRQAQILLGSIPPTLLGAAHDPFSARALVYLLLLDTDETIVRRQMRWLREHADAGVVTALERLQAEHPSIAPEIRLPLISLCLPVLRQLSPEQYPLFRQNLLALIETDGRTSLWEWVLQRVVLQQLDGVFQPRSRFHHTAHRSLEHLKSQCAVLLAFLVKAGRQQMLDERVVFGHAFATLGFPAESLNKPGESNRSLDEKGVNERHLDTIGGAADFAMPEADALSIDGINAALEDLVRLRPLQKPLFLKACAVAISADGTATITELEIFRAIAAALDCPLPPLPTMPPLPLQQTSGSVPGS